MSKDLQSQFLEKVAITLLITSALIEFFSVFGLSIGVSAAFPYPLDNIVAAAFVAISLLCSCCLLKRSIVGIYLSVFASAFLLVLGCFNGAKTFASGLMSQSRLLSSTISIVLGVSLLPCIFGLAQSLEALRIRKTHPLKSRLESRGLHEKLTIEIYDAKKDYVLDQNVVHAINDLTLKVRKGEFVAIMGPSGSGKSTLLNLIGALDRPSSGRVFIDGVDISLLDENGLARLRNEKIGFVFQAYNLIARSTVLRNMELPAFVKGYSRNERMNRARDLLSAVGLNDKLIRKPNTLSGGEQQRVAIARALMNNPEILLADEPTGNVDSKQGLLIMRFLRKLNQEKEATVVVVTHDPEVARTADRIVHIKDGRVEREEMVNGVTA